MLSLAQKQQYRKDGYISPIDGLNADEIRGARQSVDRLVSELGTRDAYAINCYQARVATLWDLCATPIILDAVESLIGPNIVCWASHLFNKQPGDARAVPWHQDAVFWSLAPANTLTVWLAIDDADADNSALEFIPRSHTASLPWEENDGGDVLNKQAINVEQFGASVVNTLSAGQFSIHHDLLLHGSQPNRSKRRRCGLTLRYCTPDVRVTDPQWGQGIEAIVVRGEDPAGYWKHHARPLGDTIVGVDSPRSVGGN